MKTSPTQRSLKHLKEQGLVCQVVEKWNPYARVRVDLFGCIDIVCLEPSGSIIGVQTTTTDHISHRVQKMHQEPAIRLWAKANKVIVHGWSKKGGRGKRKLWTLTERDVTVELCQLQESSSPPSLEL